MKSIIVAYDKHYGIGADNDLLWMGELPADMAHFKANTTGSTVIMGYNTYRSLGRPLPNRRNIVISEKPDQFDGFEVVGSLEEAFDISRADEKVFVIGGGYIYAQAINLVDEIIATEVGHIFDNATIFFPEVDKSIWHEISRDYHAADNVNKYSYDFVIYRRA